jgi:predicted flavoprotein YhiN
VQALAGVTLDDVEVQLRETSGRVVWRRRRPCLFTHSGLSGPGPMDASSRLEREPGRWTFGIDLCPDLPAAMLAAELFTGAGRLVPVLQRRCRLPRRLAEHLVASHGLLETPPAQVPAGKRRALVDDLKGLPVPIDGSTGFAHAELTAGGLDLDQVDPRTMEVRAFPGLFVTGELLDVDGPIGGFSFLAAFGTGVLAGRAAAARCGRRARG